MAKNLTYSDRQAGELQLTSSVRAAQPEAVANASLPEVGATVALDHYGTCEVLRHEPGLGGITMVALKCTSAGHKTFIGQEFKLSGPLVARLHTAHRKYVVDEQLTRFFGRVTTDIAHLGPSAWLAFLRWFQAVQPDTLPVAEEPQQSQGPIAELYTLHERTLRGFATQPPVDQHVSFVVTIERRKKNVDVTDDLPAEEIGRIASSIASEPAEDHAWRRYRRFVASSVPRLVDKTRQIVRYTVDRQQEWLRTGRLLEQQRLTRSSTGLVAACDVAPRTAQLLVRSIGPIRVGDRVIEFDSLFTGSDFERAHLVVALTETLTAMGVSDPQRLTLAQERDLRERANAVLNEEMPTYLHRPIADDRLHRCLVMAAPQAKPASAVAAAAGKLWEAETAALRTVLRQHSWRYAAAAATLDVTAARLIEQVRRHDLVQALLDDRHAFICRVYRKAVPEKRTYDDISMVGVRAVAAALRITIGEDIGTPEQGKRRTVEDWVREALHYADAPRTQEIQAQQVEDALARHHGSIRFAAHALHIRERAVVELVDRFQLWERVQGHEDLKIERGLILRK